MFGTRKQKKVTYMGGETDLAASKKRRGRGTRKHRQHRGDLMPSSSAFKNEKKPHVISQIFRRRGRGEEILQKRRNRAVREPLF